MPSHLRAERVVMPRAEISPAGKIVQFFQTAPIETADLILGLCKDAVTGRKQKSAQAKQRAQTGATVGGPAPTVGPAPTAAQKKKAKAKAKQGKAKSAAATPTAEPVGSEPYLPGADAVPGDIEYAGVGAGEAGDLQA
jgi:hypothetical protein